jgi:glutamate/tyrosine decarboxylase-like PLP-dependent enzyme
MLPENIIPPSLYPTNSSDFNHNLHTLQKELKISSLPAEGLNDNEAHLASISNAVIHGLAPSFFGWVTGGVTPAAAYADNVVTAMDANVGVHHQDISIATDVEDTALRWLLELFNLPAEEFTHRTFTTGATASNVVGLACARDYLVRKEAVKQGKHDVTAAELGLHGALKELGIEGIQILSSMPHSSLRKAASLVGLGRSCFVDVMSPDQSDDIVVNTDVITKHLAREKWLSIVAVSCGEVNTGRFATHGGAMAGGATMESLRSLCNTYNAWLHVDAAFGLLACCLEDKAEYKVLKEGVKDLQLADSIASDGHKLLNVPYDCGVFFSKHLDIATSVFSNVGAAYLALSLEATLPSPMNIGIENSRRFRALPVYASLRAYGASGYRLMVERMIETSRIVAKWIDESRDYTLLPEQRLSLGGSERSTNKYQDIFMIVLFRAKDENFNDDLIDRINGTGEVWMSGSAWGGKKAVRIAVANWQVKPDRESKTVIKVLQDVAKAWSQK